MLQKICTDTVVQISKCTADKKLKFKNDRVILKEKWSKENISTS